MESLSWNELPKITETAVDDRHANHVRELYRDLYRKGAEGLQDWQIKSDLETIDKHIRPGHCIRVWTHLEGVSSSEDIHHEWVGLDQVYKHIDNRFADADE